MSFNAPQLCVETKNQYSWSNSYSWTR